MSTYATTPIMLVRVKEVKLALKR